MVLEAVVNVPWQVVPEQPDQSIQKTLFATAGATRADRRVREAIFMVAGQVGIVLGLLLPIENCEPSNRAMLLDLGK